MRDLSDVISKIIKLIPKTSSNKSLIYDLEQAAEGGLYAAPEMQSRLWCRCATILSDELGPPDTDWKKQISDLFADKITTEGIGKAV